MKKNSERSSVGLGGTKGSSPRNSKSKRQEQLAEKLNYHAHKQRLAASLAELEAGYQSEYGRVSMKNLKKQGDIETGNLSGIQKTGGEKEDFLRTSQRLQKVLARAGVASRRECEKLITSGRVKVNGQVERTLGAQVIPAKVQLHVDDMPILLDDSKITVLLNKPIGVECTLGQAAPEAKNLESYIAPYGRRLYHVGRLDTNTSGLLLLSNDGELAHRLMHPSWKIPKTYVALVKGNLKGDSVKKLKDGIDLEDGMARADRISIKAKQGQRTLVEIELHEGRNRIVRRMFAQIGHPVLELTRIRLGKITLGVLKPGQSRELSPGELAELMASVGL